MRVYVVMNCDCDGAEESWIDSIWATLELALKRADEINVSRDMIENHVVKEVEK